MNIAIKDIPLDNKSIKPGTIFTRSLASDAIVFMLLDNGDMVDLQDGVVHSFVNDDCYPIYCLGFSRSAPHAS